MLLARSGATWLLDAATIRVVQEPSVPVAAKPSVVLRRGATPIALHLMAILSATTLCTLINPYGAELHRWLFEAISVPRPEIVEWHALDWGLGLISKVGA